MIRALTIAACLTTLCACSTTRSPPPPIDPPRIECQARDLRAAEPLPQLQDGRPETLARALAEVAGAYRDLARRHRRLVGCVEAYNAPADER